MKKINRQRLGQDAACSAPIHDGKPTKGKHAQAIDTFGIYELLSDMAMNHYQFFGTKNTNTVENMTLSVE
ncbi:uncharacterized protein Dvar_42190 [Desulfosarcina variabilis str. Montpellier]|uniref:hypothetical protein n=1 Tax=Desulfosarcina variabilis TaxID=2300 RepID=UPI003AFB6E23